MVDVKDGNENERWIIFCCSECEKETGVPVELRVDYSDGSRAEMNRRRAEMEFFDRIHESCGEKELNERISKYFSDPGDEKLQFCQACSAENPKMPFAEIKSRWKSIQQMKRENENGTL